MSELDATKTAAVRAYLQHEFPGWIVYDFYDPARSAHVFQIVDSRGTVLHIVVMRAEFLDAHSDADVVAFLERHGVGRALVEAGPRPLVVSDHGLTREAA